MPPRTNIKPRPYASFSPRAPELHPNPRPRAPASIRTSKHQSSLRRHPAPATTMMMTTMMAARGGRRGHTAWIELFVNQKRSKRLPSLAPLGLIPLMTFAPFGLIPFGVIPLSGLGEVHTAIPLSGLGELQTLLLAKTNDGRCQRPRANRKIRFLGGAPNPTTLCI